MKLFLLNLNFLRSSGSGVCACLDFTRIPLQLHGRFLKSSLTAATAPYHLGCPADSAKRIRLHPAIYNWELKAQEGINHLDDRISSRHMTVV